MFGLSANFCNIDICALHYNRIYLLAVKFVGCEYVSCESVWECLKGFMADVSFSFGYLVFLGVLIGFLAQVLGKFGKSYGRCCIDFQCDFAR